MPTTGRASSEPLKTTHPLPIGDGGVECGKLNPRVVQVMLDDVVAECLASDPRRREQVSGLGQRGRQPLPTAVISVAGQRLWQLQFLLDAVQASGDQGRHREILVDV